MSRWRGMLHRLPVAVRAFRLRLICRDAVGGEANFSLRQLPAVIGRGQDVDARLVDTWASRHHCEIDVVDGGLAVRDLGSRNGTLVNGEVVSQSFLRPGDQLTVGLSTFEVQYNPERLGVVQSGAL